jgi:hypothetical protein
LLPDMRLDPLFNSSEFMQKCAYLYHLFNGVNNVINTGQEIFF